MSAQSTNDKRPGFDLSRRLGGQSVYALLGNIFTLFVGLPLQILVSRVLGPAELGVYALLDGAVHTAGDLLSVGVAPTAMRYIPEHLRERQFQSIRRLIKMSVVLLVTVGGLAYLVGIIAVPFLVRIYPELQPYTMALCLMGLLLPLGLLLFFLQECLRGFHAIKNVVLATSVLQLATKALVTLALFGIGLRLMGYVAATAAAYVVAIIWMGWELRRKLRGLPRSDSALLDPKQELAQWRRYATICYSNGIITVAAARIDRFILGAIAGISAVGVLLVVRQLQQLPQVFNQMLLKGGTPMLAAVARSNDKSERQYLHAILTDWSLKASLPLMLFLVVFDVPVLHLFGPAFAVQGRGIMWLFILAQAFNMACGPVGTIALMGGIEHIWLRVSISATIVAIALNVGLTISYGLTGVAMAALGTAIFSQGAFLVVLRRYLAFRWWNRRFLSWVFPTLVCAGLGWSLRIGDFGSGPIALIAYLGAMYGAFLGCVLLQGLREDERDLLAHLLSQPSDEPA